MLLITDHNRNNAFGFRFQEIEQTNVANLKIIGYENQTTTDYYWDGTTREDVDIYIFQYTLSGKGCFEIDHTVYEMTPGKGFFVGIPSSSRYYLPQESQKWQFIFITLSGQEAKNCWQFINETHGFVFDIATDSSLIQQLFSTYNETTEGKITDSYIASGKAYSFIMECYRHFNKNQIMPEKELPETISNALIFIQTRYNQSLTLDDIANEVNLSKYYFIKTFKKYIQLTPAQYLTKYRIEKAFYLLQNTNKTVKEISSEVGFSDPNYFCKVFRSIVGTSPGIFRQHNSLKPFTHLVTE